VLVLALLLPSINSPTVPFGVRVPAQRADHPTELRQTRIYRWRVLVSGIVAAVIGVVIYSVTGETLLLPLSVLVLVGLWYGCFFLANHEIRAAKAAGGWYEGLHQGIAVDTELRTDPPRFPWLWLAPALIVMVATVVIGVISYPSMPEILAVHYGAKGVPNRLAAKSVGTAFSLVFVQIGVTALLVGIAATIFRSSRPDIDPARPVGSARWHRQPLSQWATKRRADSSDGITVDVCTCRSGVLKTPGKKPITLGTEVSALCGATKYIAAQSDNEYSTGNSPCSSSPYSSPVEQVHGRRITVEGGGSSWSAGGASGRV